MNNDSNKKYKRPKQKTLATTNPEAPRTPNTNRNEDRSECPEPVCPLLAKDSEWVDILQSPLPNAEEPSGSSVGDDEAVLQLVECEDGPQTKPLAVMFPSLLERDPQTLEGMLTKAMSTTEVTKHLVDLGEKANFSFMKKSSRLIPRDKQWLESVSEISNSHCSLESYFFPSSVSSDYEADKESTEQQTRNLRKLRKRLATRSEGRGVNRNYLQESSISDNEESFSPHINEAATALPVDQLQEQTNSTHTLLNETTESVKELDINKS